MNPYYEDDHVTVHAGDCLNVMAELPDASVDAVVTDPPYGLDFMGKHWDDGAVAFDVQTWRQCLRLLKPGGHIVSFGGTRTFHRMAVAIEDAGFEIRDSIAWLYGSGFPKSLDVSKAIDKAAGVEREVVGPLQSVANHNLPGTGARFRNIAELSGERVEVSTMTVPATDLAKQWAGWGTALKPAFEPIVVGRKPLRGTVAANVVEHGTGALNIAACRVEGVVPSVPQPRFGVAKGVTDFGSGVGRNGEMSSAPAGRWPTNVVIDEHTAAGIDAQSGMSGAHSVGRLAREYGYAQGGQVPSDQPFDYGDTGGASRFFPTFRYEAKAGTAERPNVGGIAHPTVKPVDLMRWLVRLVTPPGGVVLDPFAGSGTTAEACIHEHLRCITIEREPDYLPLIVARLSKPMEIGFNFGEGA